MAIKYGIASTTRTTAAYWLLERHRLRCKTGEFQDRAPDHSSAEK